MAGPRALPPTLHFAPELLLQAQGLSAQAALGVAMLVGPAQVAGRLLEFGFLRRAHPLLSSRFATAGHPIGVLLLARRRRQQ